MWFFHIRNMGRKWWFLFELTYVANCNFVKIQKAVLASTRKKLGYHLELPNSRLGLESSQNYS